MENSVKLPIRQAVFYGWNFALTAWRPTLSAYLILAVAVGALFAISVGGGGVASAFGLPAMVIVMLLNMACMAMTLRLALSGEFEGLLELQVGGDEGRLLLAHILYGALMLFVGLVTGFVVYMLVIAYISTTIPDVSALATDQEAFQAAIFEALRSPTGRVVSLLGLVAFAVPMIWFSARLITFPAATIARKKIMIFETWSWTKGLAIPVMISLVICVGPFWVLSNIGQWLATFLLGLPWLPMWNEQVFQNVSFLQAFLIGFVSNVFTIPLSLVAAGLSAFMRNGFDPKQVS